MSVLYFTDQPFFGILQFGLQKDTINIDLKFQGSISDVNIDNPAKFHKFSMPKSCISTNRVLTYNLQTSQVTSNFDLEPPH